MHRLSILLIVIIFVPRVSFGEETKDQLPAPGTWVKFLVTGPESDEQRTLTVKLLDRILEQDERYVRVEYDWLIETPEKRRDLTQFLLPENSLINNRTPFDSLKQYKIVYLIGDRVNGGPIRESEVETIVVNETIRSNLNTLGWGVLFPGCRKEQETKQDQLEIPYQHGQLKCSNLIEAKEATDMTKLLAEEDKNIGRYIRQTNFRIWLHPKIPFGVAQFERRRNDIAFNQKGESLNVDPSPVTTWTVNDFGTGAKSAFPANP